MQKLKGWTMAKFVGCENCPKRGRKIVCQATRYSISRKNGVWRSVSITVRIVLMR